MIERERSKWLALWRGFYGFVFLRAFRFLLIVLIYSYACIMREALESIRKISALSLPSPPRAL